MVWRRGLIANGFMETHYLQDGTDVSSTRNYTRDSKMDLEGQRSPGILDSNSSYCPFRLRVTFSFDMPTDDPRIYPLMWLRITVTTTDTCKEMRPQWSASALAQVSGSRDPCAAFLLARD
ncbi:hypothetical protein ACRRTK_011094 [Alexandromys fortis]